MNFPKYKELLARAGVMISPRMIHLANGTLNYLNIGRWFHDRKLRPEVRCGEEDALGDRIAPFLQEPLSYLEFGVFRGDSLRRWTKLLKHPETAFHGFDSFEGLPESWGPVARRYFDVGGVMPRLDDPRVHLHKGWFTDTLPMFFQAFKPQANLVLYMDADLYSSTAFVLQQARPFMKVGTVLMFDQLWDRVHELKAFTEFLDGEKCRVECLGASRAFSQAAFRILDFGSIAQENK